MPAPSGLIVLWPGSVASIPPGATRVTTLDGKYPRGAVNGADPGATGGQATHTHTVVDHTHIQNSHTHSLVSSQGTGGGNIEFGGVSQNAIQATHTHSNTTNSATATNQNASITLDAVSNDPLLYEVIYIELDGTIDIPNQAIAYWSQSALPSDWIEHTGLKDRFAKGAATGQGGGTTGGSATHQHPNSPHTHVIDNHNHGTKSIGAGTTTGATTFTGSVFSSRTHTHSVTVSNSASVPTNSSVSITMSAESNDPPYRKLLAIQNNSGAGNTPSKVIGMWNRPLSQIPANYYLCDGQTVQGIVTPDMRGLFVKGANTVLEIGDTGGAENHTHIANPHTHSQTVHTHPASGGNSVGAVDIDPPIDIPFEIQTHPHSHSWTVGNTTATNQNTTVTINANATGTSVPPYYGVAFIMYIPGGKIYTPKTTPYSEKADPYSKKSGVLTDKTSPYSPQQPYTKKTGVYGAKSGVYTKKNPYTPKSSPYTKSDPYSPSTDPYSIKE